MPTLSGIEIAMISLSAGAAEIGEREVCLAGVIDDELYEAIVAPVLDCEGADVDIVFAQAFRDGAEPAGPVFEEYCQLLCHFISFY